MAFQEVRELAAKQYSLFTTAQAETLGLPRLKVHRLAQADAIRQVRRGVYSTSPAPSDHLEELRAAWLSLNPARTVAERLRDDDCAIVATSSAAYMYGIGNLMTYEHEFFSAKRKQSRAEDIHIRMRKVPESDIETVEGIRVTTVTRTVLDLLADGEELDHISDLLLDAVEKNLHVDWKRLWAESHKFEKVYGLDESSIFSALFSAASAEISQANFAQTIARSNFTDLDKHIVQLWSKQLEPTLQILKASYPKIEAPAIQIDFKELNELQHSIREMSQRILQDLPPIHEIYQQKMRSIQHNLSQSPDRQKEEDTDEQ